MKNIKILSAIIVALSTMPIACMDAITVGAISLYALNKDMATNVYFIEQVKLHPQLAKKYSTKSSLVVPCISSIALAAACTNYSFQALEFAGLAAVFAHKREAMTHALVDETIAKENEDIAKQQSLSKELLLEINLFFVAKALGVMDAKEKADVKAQLCSAHTKEDLSEKAFKVVANLAMQEKKLQKWPESEDMQSKHRCRHNEPDVFHYSIPTNHAPKAENLRNVEDFQINSASKSTSTHRDSFRWYTDEDATY